METAYAFLCRFQNAERTKNQTQTSCEQPQSSKQTKPFNKPPFNKQSDKQFPTRPPSDRQKAVPMEIDASMRSNQNRIYNHDTQQNDSDEPEENDHTEHEQDETDTNFQIAFVQTTPT